MNPPRERARARAREQAGTARGCALGAQVLAAMLAASALSSAAAAEADPTPGAGGALSLSVVPAQLVLGRDQAAEVRIAAPADVEELSVTASLGKIESVRRLPGGGFTAHYRPPAERYPQVAIVAAVGKGAAGLLDGWLAVPLAGQGDARIQGEPGSEVSLRVGDRSFGPRRVGEDGIAVIPVVVPPGVSEGHRGFAPVNLGIPETTLLHAVADRQAVAADRTEVVRVVAYVVAPHGAARRGEPPSVETTRGALVLRPREPGAYEGTWTLPPGAAGEERATLRLAGFPASRAVLRVTAAPGAPAAVALTVDRSSLRAGEGGDVQVSARAQDAAGNPVQAGLVVSADGGELSQEVVGPGAVRGRLRVGPRFDGREQVLVRARLSAGTAAAIQAVTLVPGPPVRARLTPAGVAARADGRAETVLALQAWDEYENPAAGSPRVKASVGPAPRLEPGGPGRWLVRYRAEAVAEPRLARLDAEVGAARGEAQLWLLPPPSTQLAFLASGGALAPAVGGTSGGQLLLGAELPLPERLSLPPADALALRLEAPVLFGSRGVVGGRERQRVAALLAGPVVKGVRPRVRWFASGTAGLAIGNAEAPGGSARAGVGLALRVVAGLALPGRRASPFVELGYLRTTGPGGGVNGVTLSAGVRLDLYRGAGGRAGE